MKLFDFKNKAFISILAFILVMTLVLSSAVLFTGCNDGSDESASSEDSSGENAEHTVTVVSDTGIAISEITVFIYSDSSLADLLAVEKTNSDGVMRFSVAAKSGYVAVLTEVPDGYAYEEQYTLNGKETTITLTTVLPTDPDKVYKNGDLMYNFSFTDIEGKTHKLSELLKTKDTVVLNFWFINCGPCASEFPYLNEAYEEYKDKLEVIAVNPVDESAENIKAYASEKELSFPVVAEKLDWQSRMDITGYPTTVVIDRHGRICLVHQGAITSTEEFTKVFAYFTAEDYKQSVLNGMGDIETESGNVGANGNPTEVGGVTEFEMTVDPGKTEYCDVYKISNMMLTVNSPNAVIEYNGDKYNAENGAVSLYVVAEDTFTPIRLGVGNAGDKTETFKIVFTAPEGSSGNPYTLALGEFNTEIGEGNDQGVYYKYVAEKSGTLTLECVKVTEGVSYDYILYNLNSYAQRSLSADGEEGAKSVSIAVRKGDTVTVTVGTLPDSSNNYPAASFTSIASFVEGEDTDTSGDSTLVEYGITVKDNSGKAVKGVYVKFEGSEETVSLTTDDNGCASTQLSDVACKVTVTVPDGYTATVTEYTLTADINSETVTLTKKVIVMKDYTVTVKDSDGKAIKNVLVTVGESFAYTDANGKAVFNLAEDNYTATVSLPDGYKATQTSYPFSTGSTSVNVTLTKDNTQGGGDNTKKTTYSVTVKKADGTVVPNTAVIFEKNGVSASVQTTNSSGVASASLESGAYTVKLAFTGGVLLNYDKSSTGLTASKPSITVTVAEPVSDETTELYVGMAHHLSLGGNYCTLAPSEEGVTYFVFVPTRDGVYSFTTSCSSTAISYWGANTSFIYNQTDATDYKNNLFTITVKDGNLGAAYIIGVKGAEDAVVIVKRIGNPPKTIEDLPWTVYQPKEQPKAFSLGVTDKSKFTANFFDLSSKTDSYNLVYNETDGRYHLGTKNGDVVYIMLSKDAPHLSFAELVAVSGLKKYFYNSNGECYKKEDYTECMTAITEKMDPVTGLYPLNDDLIYMIRQSGEAAGWWDEDSATYLFSDVNGLNTEIAWMFALCTVTTK